jgi:hypothetical protein
MSYAENEQDAREYADLTRQFVEERLLEPTGPHDGCYLLVDDDDIEEPVAFRTIEGATDWCVFFLRFKQNGSTLYL